MFNAFSRKTPSIIKYIGTIKQRLSLVVVEDGLVQHYRQCHHVHIIVLILIVVDDGLVLQNVRVFSNNEGRVSILVVMDNGIVLLSASGITIEGLS